MKYRESGKTLTSVLTVVATTSRTRNVACNHNSSVRINVEDDFVQTSIGITKTKTHVIPYNAIKKGITITASHRFLILYRSNEDSEFNMISISTGQFHLMGAIVGQLAIQGDYDDETRCSIVYS